MLYKFESIVSELYSCFIRGNSEISLNQVPRFDPLLKLYLIEKIYQRPVKNQLDIMREYETEKWGSLLKMLVSTQDYSHKKCMVQFYGFNTVPMFFFDSVFEVEIMKYHKLVTALLSDFIIELAEGRPVDLLELGCGFGGTLMGVAIRLSQTLQLCKITGLDISESGLQILNKMSAVEGIPISTVIHDFGADIPIPKMQGGETNARVAFTNFSLSAITTYHKNPITNILRNSGAKYVIILEPMMMDKDNITLASLLTGRHIINNSYNPDIRSYINSSCNDGLCKVLYNHNEIIGSSIASAISICVLESNC